MFFPLLLLLPPPFSLFVFFTLFFLSLFNLTNVFPLFLLPFLPHFYFLPPCFYCHFMPFSSCLFG
jgi:hypothetical protein